MNHDEIKILCVGQSVDELRILSGFPKDSIWVLLYADETLDPKVNQNVLSHQSIVGVIRHYPCKKAKLSSSLQHLRYSINTSKVRTKEKSSIAFIRSIVASTLLIRRMNKVFKMHSKYRKDSIHLHLGYTNLFAHSFDSYFQFCQDSKSDHTLSLFEKRNKDVITQERPLQLCFVGQKGKFWRIKAIRELEIWRLMNPDYQVACRVRGDFSGTVGANGVTLEVGLDYLKLLHQSRFSICPPGNYSLYTFRFAESLICGALPIVCLPCPSDPLNDYREIDLPMGEIGDWQSAFSQFESISEIERIEMIDSLRLGFARHCEEVNGELKRRKESSRTF